MKTDRKNRGGSIHERQMEQLRPYIDEVVKDDPEMDETDAKFLAAQLMVSRNLFTVAGAVNALIREVESLTEEFART